MGSDELPACLPSLQKTANCNANYYYYYIHLTGLFFQDNLGKPSPEK